MALAKALEEALTRTWLRSCRCLFISQSWGTGHRAEAAGLKQTEGEQQSRARIGKRAAEIDLRANMHPEKVGE